jgi:hypothetical protein
MPRLAPSAQHDARGFGPGYDNYLQPDQLNMQAVRERVARGVAPLGDVLDDLAAQNLPPQLKQGSFLVSIPSAGTPGAQLLIPQNPQRRMSFLVANFLGAADILFSYGRPQNCGNQNGVQNLGAGVPVGNYYQEANGSASIDDIWVFCNDPLGNYPIQILGYEGGLSIAGNKL